MDQWKQQFAAKLSEVQSHWMTQFDGTLDESVNPVFDELGEFLRDNGFATAIPMQQPGRRSFKFELAEDAYLLMIFRATGLGGVELSIESAVPGVAPEPTRLNERLADINADWAEETFRSALNDFVDQLGESAAVVEEELATA